MYIWYICEIANYLINTIYKAQFMALGQSLDCHSASEVGLMDMGKSVNV